MKIIILENVRSAYNVGNILRTADALGRKVWITGYTPSPVDHPKVRKTSLGAEEYVALQQFDFTTQAITQAKREGMQVIAAEITKNAVSLASFQPHLQDIAVVFGNEVEGVLEQTLAEVDEVVAIPMQGVKESLNIGQSAAIFMRELGR
ncbi:MAG: TrmH family RNA methyltransferase [Candidatus Peribacteria bacterium]|jgi:tRNA G18 (ribose-2'-O)-methylase SpoU|nr:TrmH family RNA methyltransferase [Candidatus Peribacteria bacterium]